MTAAIIIGTFFIWIAYDVYAAKKGLATESQVLKGWGESSIFFPNMIGFLCGHWFAPHNNLWTSGWMYAIPIWVVLIAWDLYWNHTPRGPAWFRFPMIWFVLGIPVGSFFWGQPL